MNIKTNIIYYGENPQTFEGRFIAEELIPPKVGEGGFQESKKRERYINPAQNAVAEFDSSEVTKKQEMHGSLSCATCNSYITKRATSNRGIISSKLEVADFPQERVINEQEIHDLCCASCNSYINKRKTLHRRDISPDEEAIRAEPEQVIVPVPALPEGSRLDIVKAVVYGGLLQSITSLGVVVSAAGGDVSTLNIVALGLANVFGGLLVLVHNLRALKQDQNTQHYEQELGRPGHFLFHATISIISYLVFGMMSPVIYGFSFYKSDNKYLKLATLAAVSLVCITLLSMGKAYTQRPPKPYVKTIFSYVSLGVMVAGPGYIAGDLANMLLKKLEMFESLSSDNIIRIEAEVVRRAWPSY